MKKRVSLFLLALMLIVSACSANKDEATPKDSTDTTDRNSTEVNLYTSRHYDVDNELYKKFKEETGIQVNVIKGEADELIERIVREGEATKADLFLTADVGRLYRAKEQGLLQAVSSDKLSKQVPEKFRDSENMWVGLTKRARILVYNKDQVDASQLSTYEALTEDEWKGRVLVRSSESVYNQSLLASFIAIDGEEKAKAWAQGIVHNMAQSPQGGDRDQAKAIAAGIGDIAIMNTYYLGQMLNSEDAEEVKVAEQLGIFFPNQETTGTHVNISGAGVVKGSKNADNALKLLEFLTGEEAQYQFAETNYEYPVNPAVEPAELLTSWGTFKEQDIQLTVLGENNAKAIMLFNEVGWK